MKLGTQVCLGPGDIVLDRDPAPPKGHSPQLSAHICCSQMAAWIKMPLGMDVSLGPGDFVVDGDPAPLPQEGGGAPQIFGTCLLWPMAGWIKMVLGMDVGLSPGDFVLDGDWGPSSPSPRRKLSPLPNFGPCLLWPNGWMDQDGARHGGGPWSRQHCARWGDTAPLPRKEA